MNVRIGHIVVDGAAQNNRHKSQGGSEGASDQLGAISGSMRNVKLEWVTRSCMERTRAAATFTDKILTGKKACLLLCYRVEVQTPFCSCVPIWLCSEGTRRLRLETLPNKPRTRRVSISVSQLFDRISSAHLSEDFLLRPHQLGKTKERS